MDDQKSQIIDEQTTTHIDIQSTQPNINSQFYTSANTSLIHTSNYDQMDDSFKKNNHSPQGSDNQFCTQFQKYPNDELISQYQNQIQQTSQNKPCKPSLELQKFALCLQSIEYSLTRVFYRAFQNKLISFYIQSLKQQQRKQRQTRQIQIKLLKQQNWPFKQLFYKKYRNENQQIMFEFINMCAQKIQTTFKGYITSKRHKQAKRKINNFKEKLSAITIGWKTWNIYNCKKLKQMRKTVMGISAQIDSQIENPNIDRIKKMKKIDYLNSSQQVQKQNFHNTFKHLFNSGAWIYEVEKCFKKSTMKEKPKRNMQSYHFQEQNPNQVQENTSQKTAQINQGKPRTRKREFQGGLTRNSKKQVTPSKPNTSYEEQPIKAKGSYETSTPPQGSGLQQRPIVAKGKYEIKEQDIKNSQNQFMKANDNQKPNENKEQHQSPRINKFKDDEKKKLIKRQKYDPRKAIEEEKLRLEEQKKKKLEAQKQVLQENPTQPQNTGQKKKPQKKVAQVNKKTPRISKKEPQRREIESPRESSKEKTVEKVKSNLTKKNDNSKSIKLIVNNKKVESKVDCWGPKKDSSQTQISANNEQSSYKSKYLISLKEKAESKMTQGSSYKQVQGSRRFQNRDQKSISVNEEEFIRFKQDAPKIINKIQKKNTQTDEEETFQSSYLRKLVEQKEKGSFSYSGGKMPGQSAQRKYIQKVQSATQQSYAQKIQQLNNNMKRLSQNRSSTANLKQTQQQQRKGSISQAPQTQSQKKKQQVHRSIEFLEDVYSGQYTDRYNTLKNKLNMLESTRYIQRDDSIPILLEDSKFIKKIYKDHAFSSLYWPQVRTMETNFLDYIKFSGF